MVAKKLNIYSDFRKQISFVSWRIIDIYLVVISEIIFKSITEPECFVKNQVCFHGGGK